MTPHQSIFSLYDMLKFYASPFLEIMTVLGQLDVLCENAGTVVAQDSHRKIIRKRCDIIRERCNEVNLTLSSLSIARIDTILDRNKSTFAEITPALKDLNNRLVDEMKMVLLMRIPPEKAKLFEAPDKFWGEQVLKAFSPIAFDAEEACKCFAASRNTACVFHLMRVMETGLRALGSTLNIQNANPGWESILDKCDKELSRPIKDRSPAWNKHSSFCDEATANLRAVKNAWRNPTMHIGKKYLDDEAENILFAVRGFMAHLATRLKVKYKNKLEVSKSETVAPNHTSHTPSPS